MFKIIYGRLVSALTCKEPEDHNSHTHKKKKVEQTKINDIFKTHQRVEVTKASCHPKTGKTS